VLAWPKPNIVGGVLFVGFSVALWSEVARSFTGVTPDWLWAVLSATVITLFLACMGMGRSFPDRGKGLYHVIYVLVLVAVATLGYAALTALGNYSSYWGYWIQRPSVDEHIARATKVSSVTPVRTTRSDDGRLQFALNRWHMEGSQYRVPHGFSAGDEYRHRDPERRVLISLEHAKILPQLAPALPETQLRQIYDALQSTSQLLNSSKLLDSNYDWWGELRGLLFVLEGPRNTHGMPQRYLVAAVYGGKVYDHHPYYEFVFSYKGPYEPPSLLACTSFFFDTAHREAEEGVQVLISSIERSCSLGLKISLPLALLVLLVRWRSRERRLRANPAS